jgi:hypothetical protein
VGLNSSTLVVQLVEMLLFLLEVYLEDESD